MKIGYLGPAGTFSEQAAYAYGKNIKDGEYVSFDTIVDVLLAVSEGEISQGVVPLENSIEGAVTSTIDMLIFQEDLFIQAEVVMVIKEDMLVSQGYDEEAVLKILSHPQALGQCARFLKKHYPKSQLIPVASTAEAARMVAQGERGMACLAPSQAAKVYNLKTIHENVQDEKHNETRFVIVANKQPEMAALPLKTSIVFSTRHQPGELHRILDFLARWNINMTKIESRPSKRQLGEYVFFVDLEAKSKKDLESARNMIEKQARYFKFLGSYPVLQ